MDAKKKLDPNNYLPLLKIIAKARHAKLVSMGIYYFELEDLQNEGYFGLNIALETFDFNKGTTFEYWAKKKINNAINQFLRKADSVDHRVRAKLKVLAKIESILEQQYGRKAIAEEIAEELIKRDLGENISQEVIENNLDDYVDDILNLRKKAVFIEYIDSDLENDEGQLKIEKVIPSQETASDTKVASMELGKATDDCIKSVLDKTEMLILLLHDLRSLTNNDIAHIIYNQQSEKYSQRIRRKLFKARDKIIICLKEKGFDGPDFML